MCGICGVIDYKLNAQIGDDVIRKMCSKMAHRGPDSEGVYINNSSPSVGLGHRRLNIIDLSSAGHQPFSNEDDTAWITFNGEIYNYRDLRQDLESKGHKFKSHTDTETIIHLYEEFGADCVSRLRGMFAFAIWDVRKKALLIARDRVGKKPLLYAHRGGVLCFASEFSALLASGLISKEIDNEALDYYLTFGYIPAPLTIYRDVRKLLPAHTLTLKDNKLASERYWKLDYSKKINISESDAADEVLRLLREATKIRLFSDVPLGAFLSGGIDSSAVVALMSQLSDKKVKTFTIGFEEKDYSELSYARSVSERFNTEHHEFIVKPKALEILPLLVEHYGEPYADSSCIPTYYVCKETKKYVTVALNGDGGDELFAGYDRYQAMMISQKYQDIPQFAKSIVRRLSKIIPDSVNSKNKLRRIKRFASALDMPLKERYVRWVGIFDDELKKKIYSNRFLNTISQSKPIGVIAPFFNIEHLSLLDSLLYADSMTYLPGDLLVKVDIASMANSLEARSPFLDHKLLEFAARLPSQYKMKNLIKKFILKKALRGLIPQANIRRKKMGFGVPIGKWFAGDMRGFLSTTLLSQKAQGRGYFNPAIISDMLKRHIARQTDYSFQLWAILMLELWHQQIMD